MQTTISTEERTAAQVGQLSGAEHTARALTLAVLLAVPTLICCHLASASATDADLGWQLRTGAWIVAHRRFPHSDPFSRTAAGQPWQAYSWLFDLILLKLHGWLNLDGVVVYTAALTALITAAVYRMVSRLQPDFAKAALLTLAAMLCMSREFTPRPWLFTILFFTLELDILMRVRLQGGRGGEVQGSKSGLRPSIWLLPLFALWANIHIQFIDGLLVLAIAACEPLLNRLLQRGRPTHSAGALSLTLMGCIGATFLNPYGVKIYASAWELGSQRGVLSTVGEMQSLPFRSGTDYLLLFLALGAAGVLFRDRKLPPFETLMLAAAAVLSFRSQRDLWFMAITAAMILAAGSREGLRQDVRWPVWAPLLAVFAATGLIWSGATAMGVNNTRLRVLQAKQMPVEAVEVMQQRHYNGRLFNPYDWGGFLMWELREPVSIDGRAGLYGDARIARSMDTWGGKPDWATDPDLESAQVVVAPVNDALTQLLKMDPRFRLGYEDGVAAIFLARSAEGGGSSGTSRENSAALR